MDEMGTEYAAFFELPGSGEREIPDTEEPLEVWTWEIGTAPPENTTPPVKVTPRFAGLPPPRSAEGKLLTAIYDASRANNEGKTICVSAREKEHFRRFMRQCGGKLPTDMLWEFATHLWANHASTMDRCDEFEYEMALSNLSVLLWGGPVGVHPWHYLESWLLQTPDADWGPDTCA